MHFLDQLEKLSLLKYYVYNSRRPLEVILSLLWPWSMEENYIIHIQLGRKLNDTPWSLSFPDEGTSSLLKGNFRGVVAELKAECQKQNQ